jgi:hypothetical protein
VEETGVPWENHRAAASHWQTLSQNASTDKTTIIAIVIEVVVLTVLVITAISTKDTWIVNFTSIKQENSSTVNCFYCL